MTLVLLQLSLYEAPQWWQAVTYGIQLDALTI